MHSEKEDKALKQMLWCMQPYLPSPSDAHGNDGLVESIRVCWVPLFGKIVLLRRVEQGNQRADSDEETGIEVTKVFIKTQGEDGVQARGSSGGLQETRCIG
jgi:hypothetical protein